MMGRRTLFLFKEPGERETETGRVDAGRRLANRQRATCWAPRRGPDWGRGGEDAGNLPLELTSSGTFVSPVVGRLSPNLLRLRYHGKMVWGRTRMRIAEASPSPPLIALYASWPFQETFAYWVTNPIPTHTHTTRRRFLTENKHPQFRASALLQLRAPCGNNLLRP